MKSLTALTQLIEENIKQNGNGDITGNVLQNILLEIAQNAQEERLLAGAGLVAGDIGKALMLNPDNGKAEVYTDSPAIDGENSVFTLVVDSLTPNPAGQGASASFTALAQPSEGDIFTVNEGNGDVVFTFKASPSGATDVLIDSTINKTMLALALKIEDNTNDLAATVVNETITLKDDKTSYAAANNVWYLKNNTADPIYFTGGAAPAERSISLYDAAGDSTVTIQAEQWNNYASPPATTEDEAQDIASYIVANLTDFTANWVEGTSSLTVTSVNPPTLESAHAISTTGLTNVTVTVTEAGSPDVPAHAGSLFIGFLGGLEEEGGTSYAVVRGGKYQTATLAGNNPIDLSHYSPTGLNGYPSGLLVATTGGKLRTIASPLDAFGFVGMAVTGAVDQAEDQTVTVREVFIPLWGG